MNFINQAKQTVNKINGGATAPLKNNPFEKKTASASSIPQPTSIPGKIPGKPPVGKPPVGMPPIGKPPVGKPPVVGKVPPVPTPVKEEKIEEVKEVTEVNSVTETKEVENTPIDTPVVKEETKIEETVTEEKVEEKKEEKKEEPKATTKGKRKGKAASTKKAKETTTTEPTEAFEIPTTEMSYGECVEKINSRFVEKEWEERKAKIENEYVEIHIRNDMNKMQINGLLDEIDRLRDSIVFIYTDTKTLYDKLSTKDDGLIDIVKKMNAVGSNAEERKINSIKAAMQHDGINLYELLDETRSRYYFLKAIMDSLEFKKGILLTMLSSKKSEK